MWLDSWVGADAAGYIEDRFGCDSFRPNGANTAGFCDPQVSALAKQGRSTADQGQRDATLKQAQERLSTDAAALWLFAVKEAAGKATGDAKLQAEGKADKAKGAVKSAVGRAADAAKRK